MNTPRSVFLRFHYNIGIWTKLCVVQVSESSAISGKDYTNPLKINDITVTPASQATGATVVQVEVEAEVTLANPSVEASLDEYAHVVVVELETAAAMEADPVDSL